MPERLDCRDVEKEGMTRVEPRQPPQATVQALTDVLSMLPDDYRVSVNMADNLTVRDEHGEFAGYIKFDNGQAGFYPVVEGRRIRRTQGTPVDIDSPEGERLWTQRKKVKRS